MTLTPHAYHDGDLELIGEVARPAGAPKAAILILHEINGIGDNVRRRAKQLAELGYLAFAADLYGGGQAYEGDEATRRMNALRDDTDAWRRRLNHSLDALKGIDGVDRSRVAAIGYCFGGGGALELARSGAELAGVVSFHGLLATRQPSERGQVRTRILACHGARDPLVPWGDVDAFRAEMESADADWQLIAYGRAVHAFTNPGVAGGARPGLDYDPTADRQSWAAMLAFFDELFER